MQAESKFRIKVRKDLEALRLSGLPIWFTKTQQVAIAGTPDFLICANGRFIALELKKDGKAPITKLQGWNLDRIAVARGIGKVCCPDTYPVFLNQLGILLRAAPCSFLYLF